MEEGRKGVSMQAVLSSGSRGLWAVQVCSGRGPRSPRWASAERESRDLYVFEPGLSAAQLCTESPSLLCASDLPGSSVKLPFLSVCFLSCFLILKRLQKFLDEGCLAKQHLWVLAQRVAPVCQRFS